MKKLFILLFAVAIATAATKAQEPLDPKPPVKKTPEERAQRMTDHMVKALTLTDDQKTKIHALILKRETERDDVEAKVKGKREEMEKQTEDEMKKILNAEQFDKFKKHQDEMKKKREEKRMPPDEDGNEPPLPPSPPAPPAQQPK
jgi:Spy/CpxP family protein refolding chaperone